MKHLQLSTNRERNMRTIERGRRNVKKIPETQAVKHWPRAVTTLDSRTTMNTAAVAFPALKKGMKSTKPAKETISGTVKSHKGVKTRGCDGEW